jgi:hypothetical protein
MCVGEATKNKKQTIKIQNSNLILKSHEQDPTSAACCTSLAEIQKNCWLFTVL